MRVRTPHYRPTHTPFFQRGICTICEFLPFWNLLHGTINMCGECRFIRLTDTYNCEVSSHKSKVRSPIKMAKLFQNFVFLAIFIGCRNSNTSSWSLLQRLKFKLDRSWNILCDLPMPYSFETINFRVKDRFPFPNRESTQSQFSLHIFNFNENIFFLHFISSLTHQ